MKLHGVRQLLGFVDRHAAWFFGIYVLAGLRRKDGAERVPMIAGGDLDRIDVVAAEDFHHVVAFIAVLVAVLFVGHSPDGFAPRFLHVGDGDELDVRLGEETGKHLPPPRADADAAHDDAVAGCYGTVFAKGGARNDRWHADGEGGSSEEFPASEIRAHRFLTTKVTSLDFQSGFEPQKQPLDGASVAGFWRATIKRILFPLPLTRRSR